MQTQWQQFLLVQGAQLDAQEQVTFANSADAIDGLDANGVICSLDHLGCIRAAGPDAQSFLQGQFSNDIKKVENAQGQISAYCNPKGRILAHFMVLQDNEDYLLLLPRAILAPILKRLRMYVLRSQVTLTDASEERVCLGLAGKAIADKLDSTTRLPTDDYQVNRSEHYLVCKLPGPSPRFLLMTEFGQASVLWTKLATHVVASDQHVWHWLDIQAGLPSIWPQTMEEFVPQMVNLDLINGVNFDKGCYPGQEIVARMHYLGKPKRRMYHLVLDQGEAPVPGTDIYVAGGDGQRAGKIVLAESSREDTECLAVIQNDKVHADLRLSSGDGPKLTVAKLPYTVETA